jgi:hypothetical protein
MLYNSINSYALEYNWKIVVAVISYLILVKFSKLVFVDVRLLIFIT